MRIVWRLATALVAALASVPAQAVDRYDTCVRQTETMPEAGLAEAREWRDAGGGLSARHCVALALMALKKYTLAAQSLEQLADDISLADKAGRGRAVAGKILGSGIRVELLSQAGNAWLLADRADKAYSVFSDALADISAAAPMAVELRIDRARALAAQGDFKAAVEDLDRALEGAPGRAEILVYRASARRSLGLFEAALADADKALANEPGNIFALLERANIESATGDLEAAAADWRHVGDLAPGTPAAMAAAKSLEALEKAKTQGGAP